jgi:hypothetical protein
MQDAYSSFRLRCSYFLRNWIVHHLYHLGGVKDHLQPCKTGIIDRVRVLLNELCVTGSFFLEYVAGEGCIKSVRTIV